MSTGIGKTQQRILSELESVAGQYNALTVMELSERLGCSDRQIRKAVHSLAERDLVVLTKEHGGWKGRGEYGLVKSRRWLSDSDVPTAFVVKEGEPWPGNPDYVAKRDIEFIRNGMPTGASLFVWLPENRAKRLESMAEAWGSDSFIVENLKAQEVKKVKTQPAQRKS